MFTLSISKTKTFLGDFTPEKLEEAEAAKDLCIKSLSQPNTDPKNPYGHRQHTFASLEEFTSHVGKGMGYINALIKEGDNRSKTSVVNVPLISLDFDDSPTFEQALLHLSEYNLTPNISYKSTKHTEKNHRFRFVYVLDKPLTVEQFLQVIEPLLWTMNPPHKDKKTPTNKNAPFEVDQNCKTEERLWIGGKDAKIHRPIYYTFEQLLENTANLYADQYKGEKNQQRYYRTVIDGTYSKRYMSINRYNRDIPNGINTKDEPSPQYTRLKIQFFNVELAKSRSIVMKNFLEGRGEKLEYNTQLYPLFLSLTKYKGGKTLFFEALTEKRIEQGNEPYSNAAYNGLARAYKLGKHKTDHEYTGGGTLADWFDSSLGSEFVRISDLSRQRNMSVQRMPSKDTGRPSIEAVRTNLRKDYNEYADRQELFTGAVLNRLEQSAKANPKKFFPVIKNAKAMDTLKHLIEEGGKKFVNEYAVALNYQTGIGKSHTPIQMLKEGKLKNAIFALKNHHLKEQAYREMTAQGISPERIAMTPEEPKFKSKELATQYKKLKLSGKPKQAYELLKSVSRAGSYKAYEKKWGQEDVEAANNYISQQKAAYGWNDITLTTHAMAIAKGAEMEGKYLVFDEHPIDALMKITTFNLNDFSSLIDAYETAYHTGEEKRDVFASLAVIEGHIKFLAQLLNKVLGQDEKATRLPSIPNKEELIQFLVETGRENIYHVLTSDYILPHLIMTPKGERIVQFMAGNKAVLPEFGKEVLFTSASLRPEDARKITQGKVDYIKSPYAESKGRVIFDSNDPFTRTGIKERGHQYVNTYISQVYMHVKENLRPDLTPEDVVVISYRSEAENLMWADSEVYFGKSEGVNDHIGKLVICIGSARPNSLGLYLRAMCLGYELKDVDIEEMEHKNVIVNGFRVPVYTYKNEVLTDMMIHEAQATITQANRARTVSNEDAIYWIASNFPTEDVDIHLPEILEGGKLIDKPKRVKK